MKEGLAKFTLAYKIRTEPGSEKNDANDTTNITISRTAIMLTYKDGTPLPKEIIYKKILSIVDCVNTDKYDGTEVLAVGITAFCEYPLDIRDKLTTEEDSSKERNLILRKVNDCIDSHLTNPIENNKNTNYSSYITKIKKKMRNSTKFMVGDLETIPYKIGDNNVHTPYAGGYMMIDTKKGLDDKYIEMFYAYDHKVVANDFKEMSSSL